MSESHTLEHLVTHILASKASLSSVSHIYRANDIVAEARVSLERIASLSAKNSFLGQSIASQLRIAKTVRQGLGARADGAHADFKAVLLNLDEVDSGVKYVLEVLRNTPVEPSLRPSDESNKYLYDFVEEQGLDDLRAFFRTCIDETQEAQDVLTSAIEKLDGELHGIEKVARKHSISPPAEDSGKIIETFRALETHATEMAELMQSLVRHYDLCVTALKHTEGGNEAALQVSGIIPEGDEAYDHARYSQAGPISEEERKDILTILENDAAEVDTVVQEMRDHVSEMEFQLEQINSQLQIIEIDHSSMTQATSLLNNLGQHLPDYIGESSLFMARWEEQKARIGSRMEELESLDQFYEGFLGAYDGLIVEIARRKRVQSTIDKLVANTMAEIQTIHEADADEREAFTNEQGDFIPSDLWPGLTAHPPRYEVVVQGAVAPLPTISKEVLKRALERSGRGTRK